MDSRSLHLIILLSLFLSLTTSTLISIPSSQDTIDKEAIMLIEICRHGLRSPHYQLVQRDWFKGMEPYDLAATGFGQHYRIGLNLRLKYPQLFTQLQSEEYLVWSTAKQRTRLSALAQMAALLGLYDRSGKVQKEKSPISDPRVRHALLGKGVNQMFSEDDASLDAAKQAVKIHQVENVNDTILYCVSPETCPRGHKLFQEELAKLADEALKNNPHFLKDLTQHAETFNKTLGETPLELLQACKEMGDFVSQDIFLSDNPVISPSSRAYRTFIMCHELTIMLRFYRPESGRALTTPWIKYMISALKAKANNQTKFKFNLFSTHDYSLVGILNAAGLLDMECHLDRARKGKYKANCRQPFPHPGSHIDFVLDRDSEGNHFVKMYFNRMPMDICKLKNRTADFRCPLDQFIQFWEERVHPDPVGYCQRSEQVTAVTAKVEAELFASLN